LNRKDCHSCGKPSFSAKNKDEKWICPYCGKDLSGEQLKIAKED